MWLCVFPQLYQTTSGTVDWSATCTDLASHVVTAEGSWMKVQFISDGANKTAGFTGVFSTTYQGTDKCGFDCYLENDTWVKGRILIMGSSKTVNHDHLQQYMVNFNQTD